MAQRRATLTERAHPTLFEIHVAITPTGTNTWVFQQITNRCSNAPLGAECEIRVNGSPLTPLLAAYDVAAGEPFIELHPGERLSVDWSGITDSNATGTVTFIYDDGI